MSFCGQIDLIIKFVYNLLIARLFHTLLYILGLVVKLITEIISTLKNWIVSCQLRFVLNLEYYK